MPIMARTDFGNPSGNYEPVLSDKDFEEKAKQIRHVLLHK
jgi:hypothetical protein